MKRIYFPKIQESVIVGEENIIPKPYSNEPFFMFKVGIDVHFFDDGFNDIPVDMSIFTKS